jgi:hypothetical protein
MQAQHGPVLTMNSATALMTSHTTEGRMQAALLEHFHYPNHELCHYTNGVTLKDVCRLHCLLDSIHVVQLYQGKVLASVPWILPPTP